MRWRQQQQQQQQQRQLRSQPQRRRQSSCHYTSPSECSRCWRCHPPPQALRVQGAGALGTFGALIWAPYLAVWTERRGRGAFFLVPSSQMAERWRTQWTAGPDQTPSPHRYHHPTAGASAGSSLRREGRGAPAGSQGWVACPSHVQGVLGGGSGWEKG